MTPAADLGALTLALVDIPSESRDEAAMLSRVREQMGATGIPLALDTGSALLYAPPQAKVVLAGHVDTVPAQGNRPGWRTGGVVHGLGAADMKGGVAVMLALAETRGDLGYLFFAREELPVAESALPEALAGSPLLRAAELAIMLEPTDCALEVGCLGNIMAQLVFTGVAAHSARPWLGENAAHAAVRGLAGLVDVPPRRVTQGGAEYVEVLSLVGLTSGVARNVIPPEAVAEVNFRYAPDRTEAEAEARLRELTGGAGELRIVSNAPPAPAPEGNPHVERLRAAGAGPVRAKQAWTPVAEFAAAGIPAVNLGPGDPAYAHRADEQVAEAALERAHGILLAL
jgi:succinyl-diaminopimelate desuccinylase